MLVKFGGGQPRAQILEQKNVAETFYISLGFSDFGGL